MLQEAPDSGTQLHFLHARVLQEPLDPSPTQLHLHARVVQEPLDPSHLQEALDRVCPLQEPLDKWAGEKGNPHGRPRINVARLNCRPGNRPI